MKAQGVKELLYLVFQIITYNSPSWVFASVLVYLHDDHCMYGIAVGFSPILHYYC